MERLKVQNCFRFLPLQEGVAIYLLLLATILCLGFSSMISNFFDVDYSPAVCDAIIITFFIGYCTSLISVTGISNQIQKWLLPSIIFHMIIVITSPALIIFELVAAEGSFWRAITYAVTMFLFIHMILCLNSLYRKVSENRYDALNLSVSLMSVEEEI